MPGLLPPKFLLDNFKKAIDDERAHKYCPVAGVPALREQIAKHWSPYFNDRKIDPNTDILCTNGAIGAIYSILNNMVTKGDHVHMFEPYYTQYINHIEFAGADCVTSPMYTNDKGEWFFDFDHFEKSLDENSKLLIITNPHNPSGKIFTEAEIARLSAILDKWPQVTVLSDEVYFHLPFDGRKLISFANYSESNWKKTINVFSAGKMLNCTGWKIGWAIGPKELIHQAFFVHEASVFCNNVPGQYALAMSLEQAWTEPYEGHKNYFAYVNSVFQAGRDACTKLLTLSKKIKFKPTVVESGYFMPVDISGCEDQIPEKYFVKNVNYEDDEHTQVQQMQFPDNFERVPLDFALCRYLACEMGVSCMPVSNFCLQESKAPLHNFIRIAICRPPEQFLNPVMIEKFESL